MDLKARVAILRRVDRLSADNFGDHKYLKDDVWELWVDGGPDTEFITGNTEGPWCFCSVLAPSELRFPTSPRLSDTGRTINGDKNDSQD
jgi:hypothetical protein